MSQFSSEIIKEYHLGPAAINVLEKASILAKDHIGTEHLLYGLLFDVEIMDIFAELGINLTTIVSLTQRYINKDQRTPATREGFTVTSLTLFFLLMHSAKHNNVR